MVAFAAAAAPKRVAFIVTGPEPDKPIAQTQAHYAALFAARGLDEARVAISVFAPAPTSEQVLAALQKALAETPDLICVTGRVNIEVVTREVKTVPVVFYNADDPVRDGIVRSLRMPGGNVTGVASRITQLHAKRIELFRQMRPGATTVAMLVPERVRESAVVAEFHRTLARFALKPMMILAPEKLGRDGVAAELRRGRPDAFMSIGYELPPEAWPRLQMDSGVPGLFQSPEIARRGGLLAHGPNLEEQDRRVIEIAVRILGGERPAGIPVEELAKPYVVINMATANALRIEVPASIQLLADEIVR